jgi:diguanylate cyclase (GGDEF)-like protein
LSLRVRLALVLAGIMVGPLLAAGLVVGVLVPRASDRAADAALSRAVASASTVLAERCLGLGDLTRSAAIQLSVAGGAARTDAATASAVIGPLAASRPGVTLAVLTLDRAVAVAGPLATSWDPASATGASCSRRTAGSAPPAQPQLAESADLPIQDGAPPSRVIAVQRLDGTALVALRAGLALGDVQLALIGSGAEPLASTLGPAGLRDPRPFAELARGRPSGDSDGWRYQQRTAPAGVPYAVVALTRSEGTALQRTLLVVGVLAGFALLVMLAVILGRLTGPLGQLTAAARRLGGGDLTARTHLRGADEVGTLAAAFDAMADQLQVTVEELRVSQGALAHTFARFGEALGATHDLDALLHTVVAAAQRGSDATIGGAYLGDAKCLELRLAAGPDGAELAGEGVLKGLADLAEDAVQHARLVVTDLVDVAGPAMAVPLTCDERLIGALAVARPAGAAPFDDLAVSAVTALAAHAGTAVANVRAHEETSRLSVTDPLTGAYNFRHLTTTMAREVERATRFTRPLSLLMLDLDHFKQVNDTQGHAFGDAVLREFARRLGACLREVDVVARYGGEEFVVVLPETGAEGACAVATRIVEAVRKEPFRAAGHSRTVTVSVGIAAFPDHGRSAPELMRSADGALYAAKHGGRDRWALAGGSGGKGMSVAQTG